MTANSKYATPKFCVVANVISDSLLRTNANVFILHRDNDPAKPVVRGLGKSGRQICKRIAMKRLTRFRAWWLPDHMREQVVLSWDSKAEAMEFAEGLHRTYGAMRAFNADGSILIKQGLTESEVYARTASEPDVELDRYLQHSIVADDIARELGLLL